MRGNRCRSWPTRSSMGSIPAHAGEPRPDAHGVRRDGVYPRACGGTSTTIRKTWAARGLSPRMRGNLREAPHAGMPDGSIPAHAGEPSSVIGMIISAWVYPRACGGTVEQGRWTKRHKGLSPRMRGNRTTFSGSTRASGSIPAHAGEPQHAHQDDDELRVYPRACGGTPCS